MKDDAQKLAEIRTMLDQAVPGPWTAWDQHGTINVGTDLTFAGRGRRPLSWRPIAEVDDPGSKDLIASAPTIVKFLLDRVDAVVAERDGLVNTNAELRATIDDLRKVRDDLLRATVRKLNWGNP
jgi:hypothetical protein